MHRKLILFSAGILGVFILAACGGGPTTSRGPGFITEEQAIQRAMEQLEDAAPEISGVGNPHNPVAWRMTSGEFDQRTGTSGPTADTPVWVVQVEGESHSEGLGGNNTYHYAVAVLDARSGALIGRRDSNEPLPWPKAIDAASMSDSTRMVWETPGRKATPTPTPRPATDGIHTPQDMKAQYERWPEGYKFAVEQDVVVLFAYPSPMVDWAGFAFVNHIPSVSSVTLGKPFSIVTADGNVAPAWPNREETMFSERLIVLRRYNSEEGNARLEGVLADEVLMRSILQRKAVPPLSTDTLTPAPTVTVAGTPPPAPQGVLGPRSGPGPAWPCAAY